MLRRNMRIIAGEAYRGTDLVVRVVINVVVGFLET